MHKTNIYLTIDDASSSHMKKKVDWLIERNIPALFYCRGMFFEQNFDHVVYAIKKEFIIGNHSYSHPYFSHVSLEDCFKEIERTEQLIELAYQTAGVQRPIKIIRLPFGDKGAGVNVTTSANPNEQQKIDAVQAFLREHGFVPLSFDGAEPKNQELKAYIDAYWTLDTLDYEKEFEDPLKMVAHIKQQFNQSNAKAQVVLMHDFEHTHHLWEPMMNTIIAFSNQFLLPEPFCNQ